MIKYESVFIDNKIKYNKIKYPTTVYLKITTNCMLKCNFCSQANKINQTISKEQIKKILDELRKIGVMYIYYTGGEPLLHKDICEILEYGYNKGFKQFIVTNGVLLSNKKIIDSLKYVIGIGVSLHGTPEIHNKIVGKNCFEQIIKNLNMVRKKYPKIFININCTSNNQNITKENFEYLANLSQKNDWKFTVARLNYIGGAENHEKINLNYMLKIVTDLNEKGYKINISNCIAPCTIDSKNLYLSHGCGAGNTIAAIESNGDVKICASSNIAIGNINYKSFRNIWKSKVMNEYKKMKWLPISCRICKYVNICKGGCKAELSGEFWKKSCDSNVYDIDKNIWNKIKNEKIELKFEYIRKQGKYYIIIGGISRLCNNETLRIIKQINGLNTSLDIVNKSNDKECIKQLLIALKKDNLIDVIS